MEKEGLTNHVGLGWRKKASTIMLVLDGGVRRSFSWKSDSVEGFRVPVHLKVGTRRGLSLSLSTNVMIWCERDLGGL